MARFSNRQLMIAIAIALVATLVLFGLAPAGACREPGLYPECGTGDHLVLAGALLALACLVALLVVAAIRIVRELGR
jgi:hypothetical protein